MFYLNQSFFFYLAFFFFLPFFFSLHGLTLFFIFVTFLKDTRTNMPAFPEATADCAACGTCVDACPNGLLAIVDGKAYFDPAKGDECVQCEACIGACPCGALEMKEH